MRRVAFCVSRDLELSWQKKWSTNEWMSCELQLSCLYCCLNPSFAITPQQFPFYIRKHFQCSFHFGFASTSKHADQPHCDVVVLWKQQLCCSVRFVAVTRTKCCCNGVRNVWSMPVTLIKSNNSIPAQSWHSATLGLSSSTPSLLFFSSLSQQFCLIISHFQMQSERSIAWFILGFFWVFFFASKASQHH